MIQTQKKEGINHWVLHSLRIVVEALEPFFSDSQALQCIKMLPVTELMNIPDVTFLKSTQSSAITEQT